MHWLYRPVPRFLQHLIFWIVSYLVFVQIFKSNVQAEKVDYIYAALFHLTLFPAVYINLAWLVPFFANQGRWIFYTVLSLTLLAGCSELNERFFSDWSAQILPDYFFISYFSWWEICMVFVVYMGLSTLLKLSKSWFMVNDLYRQLLQSEKDKVQAELQALKAQINPHFFFNTLNGIYAMALEKDDRLPGTILRLSHLMRYFLYDTRGEVVPLEKEWKMVQDYIALQQLRSGHLLDMEVLVDGEPGEQMLPPLVLITFLENAFKHGAKGNTGKVRIRVKLLAGQEEIYFRLENTKGLVDNVEPEDEQSGLGLENVRRRLDLLYPGRHKLEITEEEENFIVSLQMKL